MDNRTHPSDLAPSVDAPASTPVQTAGEAESAAPVDRRFLLGGLAGVAGISAIAAIAGGGSRASAGPINPPAGPVGPTPGPESRTAVNAVNTPGAGTFAFRITQPGSYYLAGNIQLSNNQGGIEIVASGVTLDLNGFTLDGGYPGTASTTYDGVLVNGVRSNITIANGQISNWGSRGVRVNNAGSSSIALERLAVSGCPTCIEVSAPGLRVTDCSTNGGQVGMQLAAGTVVDRCAVRGSVSTGLVVQDGSSLEGCTVHACGGNGFNIGAGSTVSRCVAQSNTLSGFVIASAGTVDACTARSNGGVGFSISSRCSVHACAADSNGSTGIAVVDHCLVESCIATANGLAGISARQGNTIRRNVCNIQLDVNGVGIQLTTMSSGFNRVEENACTGNTRGYWVQSAGNILMRNTAAANTTQWQISTSSSLNVVAAVSSSPFVASTGGLPLSASGYDPNSNFSV